MADMNGKNNPNTEYSELLDIYGPNLVKIGKANRSLVHRDGFLHATVRVWLIIGGNIIFQERSPAKTLFPGKLDPACTGHIDSGEHPFAAALREIFEETGIKARETDMTCAGALPMPFKRPDGKRDNEFAWLYLWTPGNVDLDTTPEVSGWFSLPVQTYDELIHCETCDYSVSAPAYPNGSSIRSTRASSFCNPNKDEWQLIQSALRSVSAYRKI